MTSNDVTLTLIEMDMVYVAIGYLLMTLACGVLAARHKSWAAWLATMGFGYRAVGASMYVAWGTSRWFFPWRDVELLSYLSATLSRFNGLVLFVTALGFAIFVFRHERRRSGNSDRAA